MNTEDVVMKLTKGNTQVSFWLTQKQTAWLFGVWQKENSRRLQQLGYGGYPSSINGGVTGEWMFEANKSHLNNCAMLTVKPFVKEEKKEENYIDKYFNSRYGMTMLEFVKEYGDVAVGKVLQSEDFLIRTNQKDWDGEPVEPLQF